MVRIKNQINVLDVYCRLKNTAIKITDGPVRRIIEVSDEYEVGQ